MKYQVVASITTYMTLFVDADSPEEAAEIAEEIYAEGKLPTEADRVDNEEFDIDEVIG